jgi:glutathione S-transferase
MEITRMGWEAYVMTMKLHCFGESGNAYKAALTLTLANAEWEPVFVDFFNGATRTPDFHEINVMGEVPVLELEDGETILTQSGVIQDYVSSKTGKLGGRSAAERREVLRWMFFDNHKISSVAGPLRFMMNFMPADRRNAEVIGFLSSRLAAGLHVIEAHLDGRNWLASEEITIADIACCSYLFYPEDFTFDRIAHPNIDRWLDTIASQPGWKAPYDLMPGSPADRT